MGNIAYNLTMFDIPENIIDEPDHWSCEGCGAHFYPSYGDWEAVFRQRSEKGPGENERVLCYSFNG
jgi:hypothetical protein